MSYGVFLLVVAVMTMPATAYACACCAERGTWFQDKARADPEVLAIVGKLGSRLDQTASLYLSAAGLEEVKGISPASETYSLRRLPPHTRDWKLEFTDRGGNRGTLAFTIPDTAVYYGVDSQDGPQAGVGELLLYKEWRFEGPVAGTGIFRGGTARGARFRLIFQGRGNMCPNPDDFKSWVLQVMGPRAAYDFYGSISPRVNQAKLKQLLVCCDEPDFESGPWAVRQDEHLSLERGAGSLVQPEGLRTLTKANEGGRP